MNKINFGLFSELNNVAGASSTVNADDTLEEIEYVLDRGLNYVPKRLINEVKPTPTPNDLHPIENRFKMELETSQNSDENLENQENDENAIGNERSIRTVSDYKTVAPFDENEVIVLDSSPESSFITTHTECYKSAFESIETTYHTAKSDPNNVSVLTIDSDSTINQSEEKLSEKSFKEKSIVESLELSSSTHKDSTGIGEKFGEMPNFNDTLERVEYMMEQGRKMLNDKSSKLTPTRHAQPPHMQHVQNKKTPLSQTKTKVLTPNSATLKKVAAAKHLTPNKTDMFKRPDQRNVRSPFAAKAASASKAQPAPTQSRIPMKTGSLHKPQFRHIASPIAAYINNTPEVPLMKTIKPMRNLLTEDFNKVCTPASLDESTQSVESFPTKSALPRKMYISASQRKVN